MWSGVHQRPGSHQQRYEPGAAAAEGVNKALLTRLTLVGDDSGTAVLAKDGTTGSRVTRTILRDWDTAVLIDGATSELGIINNTILGNNIGVNATNCGPVKVRNTLFLYNPGTALQYEGCTTTNCTPTTTTGTRPTADRHALLNPDRLTGLGAARVPVRAIASLPLKRRPR